MRLYNETDGEVDEFKCKKGSKFHLQDVSVVVKSVVPPWQRPLDDFSQNVISLLCLLTLGGYFLLHGWKIINL